MLVVSRKAGERILIGESIEVTILAIRGDQVSLGVAAPREVRIHREELLDRIRRENQRAAALKDDEIRRMGERLRGVLPPTQPPASESQPPPAAAVPAGSTAAG
jgi:carbon storage regulator